MTVRLSGRARSATHHGQESLLSTQRPNTFAQTCRSTLRFSLAVRRRTIHSGTFDHDRYDIDDINEAVLVWPNRFKGGDKYVEQHFDLAYSEPSGRLR